MTKRVEVFVPVILEVYEDDSHELQLNENSVSSEISIIEDNAYNEYISGNFELLEESQ
jgi:hypothetical protein